jgi:hypothetical protein
MYCKSTYDVSNFFCRYNIWYWISNYNTTGAYDDPNGSHISIEVTSSLFEGKRPVQRQQLVYKALWEGKIYVFECLMHMCILDCNHCILTIPTINPIMIYHSQITTIRITRGSSCSRFNGMQNS